MSKSLQDQLLSLGLARTKPADKARGKSKPGKTPAGKPQHKRSQSKKAKPGGEVSLEQAYRLREQQARNQAEQARQRKREEDRRRRELNRKIRDIVQPNRLNQAEAEMSRNFLHKGRIRKVNVTPDQLKALNAGELGVVYLAGGYHLLASERVAQVKSLSEEHVPDLSGADEDEEEFPVPDDLQW